MTGVQTCALPIFGDGHGLVALSLGDRLLGRRDGGVEVAMEASAGEVGEDDALPKVEVPCLQAYRGRGNDPGGDGGGRGRGNGPDSRGELEGGGRHRGTRRRDLSAVATDGILQRRRKRLAAAAGSDTKIEKRV